MMPGPSVCVHAFVQVICWSNLLASLAEGPQISGDNSSSMNKLLSKNTTGAFLANKPQAGNVMHKAAVDTGKTVPAASMQSTQAPKNAEAKVDVTAGSQAVGDIAKLETRGKVLEAKLEKQASDLAATLEKHASETAAEKAKWEEKLNSAAKDTKTEMEKRVADAARHKKELEDAAATAQTNLQAALEKEKASAASEKEKLLEEAATKKAQLLAKVAEAEKATATAIRQRDDAVAKNHEQETSWKKEKEVLNKDQADLKENLKSTQTRATEQDAQQSSKIGDLTAQLFTQIQKGENLTEVYEDLRAQYADPSLEHFLTRKAIKAYRHPGVEGAANKTFAYVIPALRKNHDDGKKWLDDTSNSLNSLVNGSLVAYLGEEHVARWLPVASGFLVYGMVFLPLVATLWCLTRTVCKLRPCLLFYHLYFAITAFCAGVFAVVTGNDPLRAFALHDPAVYLFAQVAFGIIFSCYVLFICIACTCSRRGTCEGWYRIIQMVGASGVGAVYYVLVWTPAMTDEIPKLNPLFGDTPALYGATYFSPALLFFVLLRFEQLSWRAVSRADAATNGKVHPKEDEGMSISIREDGKLRGEELASLIGSTDPDAQGKDE